ncbi:MAG: AMP-binding protein [Rhodobacteraceae bacterium]|nr:AMP-binding protein [Paracoccaceae bacterium]
MVIEPETFVGDFDQILSQDRFDERSAKGAGALTAMGAGADVPVAIIMRNDAAQLEVMSAAAAAGTVIVALNWHSEAEEIARICSDSKTELAIIHRDLIDRLSPALTEMRLIGVTPDFALRSAYNIQDSAAATAPDVPEWSDLVQASSPLLVQAAMRPQLRYTSGSTGNPKAIRKISSGPRKDARELLRRIGTEMMQFRPGSRFFTAAPIYHSAPATLTATALESEGVSTLVAPRFDPEQFLSTIETYKITHIYLVPTMMNRLLKLPEDVKQRYDLSTVEFCVSTGSPWPHDLKAAMIDWWGPVFWESYGASEIGFMTMVSSAEALERPGTAGRMQMGGTVLILDSDGNELPTGDVGEIHARLDAFGDFDYSNDPESRKAAEKHDHVSVGDLGWVDEDGYLYITDRKKDMIISGGANIFPAEIEAVLISAPFIRDAAVFGAPDPEFGEQVVAAIEPADGWDPDPDQVRQFLKGKLASLKHPRIIEFHAALPREDTGKVFKPRLRKPYWQDSGRKI